MRFLLATGIYYPDIGGPATYIEGLVRELKKRDEKVTIITYSKMAQIQGSDGSWKVVRVKKSGGPILRWWRYAKALRAHGAGADIVIAFSSVSVGVPLALACLKKPKKILRLGGDFFWERYTDRGGMKSLREWYGSHPWSQSFMGWLLGTFDHVVFSTRFQEEIYEKHYKNLPPHSVIQNALPTRGIVIQHQKRDPFRVLFMGRFVGFKNLFALIDAMKQLSGVTLSFVGDGPLSKKLLSHAECNKISVAFHAPVHREEKDKIFQEHDLLVLPSITEISPNVALEARAKGLPILLTKETGLSSMLSQGMILRDLSTSEKIAKAIEDILIQYPANDVVVPPTKRGWENVADDFLVLCKTLL